MEAITELKTPIEDVADLDFEEETYDLPERGVFVACMSCGHRSYMFFWYKEDAAPFCKHHGEKNEPAMEAMSAPLVADWREDLVENRLVEA